MKFYIFISLLIFSKISSSQIDSLNLDCYQVIKHKNTGDTIVDRCVERNATIYVENKKFVFQGVILNEKSDTLSNSKIYFKPLNKRFYLSPRNQMSMDIYFERFKHDSILLNKLANNQNCCVWADSIQSGVSENTTKVWIRPIRNNQFALTETAPFPNVQLPLELDKQWTMDMTIESGWGEWDNKTVKSNFKILSKKVYKYKNDLISCWEIEGVTNSVDNKQNKHTYLFNEKYGFVLMQYVFFNGIKINFELIDVLLY